MRSIGILRVEHVLKPRIELLIYIGYTDEYYYDVAEKSEIVFAEGG